MTYMQEDIRKLTADELVKKVKSGEVKSCTYSTMEEFYTGMREHAIKIS